MYTKTEQLTFVSFTDMFPLELSTARKLESSICFKFLSVVIDSIYIYIIYHNLQSYEWNLCLPFVLAAL